MVGVAYMGDMCCRIRTTIKIIEHVYVIGQTTFVGLPHKGHILEHSKQHHLAKAPRKRILTNFNKAPPCISSAYVPVLGVGLPAHDAAGPVGANEARRLHLVREERLHRLLVEGGDQLAHFVLEDVPVAA